MLTIIRYLVSCKRKRDKVNKIKKMQVFFVDKKYFKSCYSKFNVLCVTNNNSKV